MFLDIIVLVVNSNLNKNLDWLSELVCILGLRELIINIIDVETVLRIKDLNDEEILRKKSSSKNEKQQQVYSPQLTELQYSWWGFSIFSKELFW